MMKTTVQNPLISAMSILALALLTSPLFAQKTANIQEGSVIAPPTIKVDGNLKEWDDSFQAYNKATKLSYTIANDDNYLYLAIKSIDPQTNNKIVAGGITFIVNTQDKKKDKDAVSITYPVIARQQRQRGQSGPGGPGGPGGGGFGGFGGRGGAPTLDSAALATQHKQTITAAKDIKIFGIKEVTDTLISIYNEFGIKAAIGYDPIGNYDYELAIPLKSLGLSTVNPKEFAYDIKVNGITMPNFGGRDGGPDGGGQGGGGRDGGAGGGGGGGRGGAGGGGDAVRGGGDGGFRGGDRGGMMEMFSPTDFWGKYTLAKK